MAGTRSGTLADSVRNNVALGEEQIDVGRELSRVCLDREVSEMENGIDTLVGSRGVRLSGGQQARTALARTLSHAKPLIVLDDPFAALDRNTEEEIFRELKAMSKDRIILLISHRLYLFDQMDQVIWMENGQTQTGTHEKCCRSFRNMQICARDGRREQTMRERLKKRCRQRRIMKFSLRWDRSAHRIFCFRLHWSSP